MYNEQIEALISAALADGMLTEKEKQILFKKAQTMGIDLDEFEMVLDARLVELQKAEKEKTEKSAPKSNKLGDVKKCPSCGAIVQSYLGACPECGYGFENISANLTSHVLAGKLEKISNEWDAKWMNLPNGTDDEQDKIWDIKKRKEQALAQVILTTTIPNTKADLFEFITMTQAAFLSTSTNYYSAAAYNTKYHEALLKAKSLFAKDEVFSQMINEEQNVQKQYLKIRYKQSRGGLKPTAKKFIIIIGMMLGCFLLMGILAEFA